MGGHGQQCCVLTEESVFPPNCGAFLRALLESADYGCGKALVAVGIFGTDRNAVLCVFLAGVVECAFVRDR